MRTLNGIAAGVALLTFVSCGSSPSAPTSSADVTIAIQGQRGSQSYSPNPITMRVGQTIAWHNSDGIAHTATGDKGGFDTGTLSGSGTGNPITMSTAGTFTYHCSFHPDMVGTIIVQ